MKAVGLLLFFLLWSGIPAAAQQQTGNIRILNLSGSPAAGELVQNVLQQQLPLLDNFFNFHLQDSAGIVIAARAEDFYRYRAATLPEWAGAAYLPAYRTILVRSPQWKGSLFSFEKSLRHELVHLYIDRLFGSAGIPLWYNEGLAEMLSGKQISLPEAGRIAVDIHRNQVMTLADIDSLTSWNRLRAEMGYLYSFSAASFLLQRLGTHRDWQRFHRAIAAQGWSAALQQQAGFGERELEVFWYRHLEEKYRWLLILNFENLLWMSIIITFLTAFWLVRRRNKRKLRSWEENEIE